MAQLPRGIAPDLLVSQVRNTMPYLFDAEEGERLASRFPPARVLRGFSDEPSMPLSHRDYFRLCACSHYLTCGTPVPTDVDNQIRHKLWSAKLPPEEAVRMAALVSESRKWDFTQVTTRYTFGAKGGPWEREPLSGHLGEWFTLASAAYCALGRYQGSETTQARQQLFEEISDEIDRHSEIFGSLWRAGEGIECLKTAATVAHNFGDLDRVMDMWELGVGDPLRLRFYKLTTTPLDPEGKLRYQGRLWVAGQLYKSLIGGSAMAFENHRHFALRKPRSLRKSPALLVPIGPFFDDWGATVARTLASGDGTPSEDTREVIEALTHGWERLPKTVGYGRALHGILEVHPELRIDALSPGARAVVERSRSSFESEWNDGALRELDDIPSRA